jgi:hypothetical protein
MVIEILGEGEPGAHVRILQLCVILLGVGCCLQQGTAGEKLAVSLSERESGIAWVDSHDRAWSGEVKIEGDSWIFSGFVSSAGKPAAAVRISGNVRGDFAHDDVGGVVAIRQTDSYVVLFGQPRMDGSDTVQLQVFTEDSAQEIQATEVSEQSLRAISAFADGIWGASSSACDPSWNQCFNLAETACGAGKIKKFTYSCDSGAVTCSFECEGNNTPPPTGD